MAKEIDTDSRACSDAAAARSASTAQQQKKHRYLESFEESKSVEESCSQRFTRVLESAVEEFLRSEYELTATNAAIKAASGSKRFNLFGMFSSQAKEAAAAQAHKRHEPYEKPTKLNPYSTIVGAT